MAVWRRCLEFCFGECCALRGIRYGVEFAAGQGRVKDDIIATAPGEICGSRPSAAECVQSLSIPRGESRAFTTQARPDRLAAGPHDRESLTARAATVTQWPSGGWSDDRPGPATARHLRQ